VTGEVRRKDSVCTGQLVDDSNPSLLEFAGPMEEDKWWAVSGHEI
jgi:hypothetical protein